MKLMWGKKKVSKKAAESILQHGVREYYIFWAQPSFQNNTILCMFLI